MVYPELLALGRTQLGKILVERRHTASQIRVLLNQDHFGSCLGSFDRRGHAADATADNQDLSLLVTHGLPPFEFLRDATSHVLAQGFAAAH